MHVGKILRDFAICFLGLVLGVGLGLGSCASDPSTPAKAPTAEGDDDEAADDDTTVAAGALVLELSASCDGEACF